MSTPMRRVNELLSSNIQNYMDNYKTWGQVMYNVLEYGVIGDGETDDTAALQQLVNRAIAEERRAIFFPHGEYVVTSLTNAEQVDFLGDNASFTGGYTGEINQLGDWATSAQLADNVSRLDELSISLVDFPRLSGEVSDSGRIERALQDIREKGNKDTLLLPDLVTISEPIRLKTNDKMTGKGEHTTVIALSPDFSGSFAVGLDSLEEGFIELRDFSIDGTGITTIAVDGVNFTNGYAHNMVGEAQHRLSNISVNNMSGKGFHFEGKGNLRVERLTAIRCIGTGFDIRVWDSWFDTLDSGLCGSTGIRVSSGPNRLVNCKVWGSNIGYEVFDKRHMLVGCEAQENWDYGFVIRGSENLLYITIDGVGFNGTTGLISDYGVGVQFTSSANNNTVIGTASNGIFNSEHPNALKSLLECPSFGNIIMITGVDWVKVSEADIDDNTNFINIMSTTAPRRTSKGGTVFRNSIQANKNGVYIGGDTSRTNGSGMFANLSGTTNTNHGVGFDSADTTVLLCGTAVKPNFDSMNIGTSGISFNNAYFKGFAKVGAFATGSRPASAPTGAMIFDSTLGKPIWRNGSNWVDSTGATV